MLYQSRFQEFGNLEDLGQAIIFKKVAIATTPDGHPARAYLHQSLASTYRAAYDRIQGVTWLDLAIEHSRNAIRVMTTINHPDLAICHDILADSYMKRLHILHEMDDLSFALQHMKLAISITTPGDPRITARYQSISTAYNTHFTLLGEMPNLEWALDYKEKSIAPISQDHQDGKPLLKSGIVRIEATFHSQAILQPLNYQEQPYQVQKDQILALVDNQITGVTLPKYPPQIQLQNLAAVHILQYGHINGPQYSPAIVRIPSPQDFGLVSTPPSEKSGKVGSFICSSGDINSGGYFTYYTQILEVLYSHISRRADEFKDAEFIMKFKNVLHISLQTMEQVLALTYEVHVPSGEFQELYGAVKVSGAATYALCSGTPGFQLGISLLCKPQFTTLKCLRKALLFKCTMVFATLQDHPLHFLALYNYWKLLAQVGYPNLPLQGTLTGTYTCEILVTAMVVSWVSGNLQIYTNHGLLPWYRAPKEVSMNYAVKFVTCHSCLKMTSLKHSAATTFQHLFQPSQANQYVYLPEKPYSVKCFQFLLFHLQGQHPSSPNKDPPAGAPDTVVYCPPHIIRNPFWMVLHKQYNILQAPMTIQELQVICQTMLNSGHRKLCSRSQHLTGKMIYPGSSQAFGRLCHVVKPGTEAFETDNVYLECHSRIQAQRGSDTPSHQLKQFSFIQAGHRISKFNCY